MKNNLRELRKRGRWSQAEIGKRLGVAHNTVSLYESGKLPLTVHLSEKFAKALEVEPAAIEIVSEDSRQDVTYPSMSIPVAVLSSELLQQIKGYLSQKLEHTQGREYQQLLEALGSIGAELDQRPAVILHEKRKPAPPNLPLTGEELAASKEYVERNVLGASAAGGKPESGRLRGAGGQPPRKGQPPGPSSGASTPGHPNPEGKGQK